MSQFLRSLRFCMILQSLAFIFPSPVRIWKYTPHPKLFVCPQNNGRHIPSFSNTQSLKILRFHLIPGNTAVILFPSGHVKWHGKLWCFQVDLKKTWRRNCPLCYHAFTENGTKYEHKLHKVSLGFRECSNVQFFVIVWEKSQRTWLVMLLPSCQQRHMKKWGHSWTENVEKMGIY